MFLNLQAFTQNHLPIYKLLSKIICQPSNFLSTIKSFQIYRLFKSILSSKGFRAFWAISWFDKNICILKMISEKRKTFI